MSLTCSSIYHVYCIRTDTRGRVSCLGLHGTEPAKSLAKLATDFNRWRKSEKGSIKTATLVVTPTGPWGTLIRTYGVSKFEMFERCIAELPNDQGVVERCPKALCLEQLTKALKDDEPGYCSPEHKRRHRRWLSGK